MDNGSYDEHQAYCEGLCPEEPEYLNALKRASYQKLMHPRMNSGILQGRFLSMISHMTKPNRVLEVGTYSGYAALCLAEGLSENGKVISLEINDELAPFHEKHLFTSELGKKIEVIYGPALASLPNISESFELIYLDADKENYAKYYPLLKLKLRTDGILLIDNMLWEGKVLLPLQEGDIQTRAILELSRMIQEDQDMELVLLPLRDGLMMVRKKS